MLDRLIRVASRFRLGLKARLAIGFGLLGLLLVYIDFGDALRVLGSADPWPILWCVLLVVTGRLLIAHRWHLLVRISNPAVSFWALLRLTFVSGFLGFAAPGAIAVELIRVYGLARGAGMALALSSVLVERLTALVALVGLLLLGLILGPLNLPEALSLWAWAAFVSVIVALLALFIRRLRALPLLLLRGRSVAPVRARFEALFAQIDLYRSRPTLLAWVVLLSITLQVFRVLEKIVLALALGIDVEPIYFFVVVPISIFVSLLPISIRGLGVRESVYVGLLGAVGVDAAAALTLSLLGFLIGSTVGLVPGVLLYATGGVAVSTSPAPKPPA